MHITMKEASYYTRKGGQKVQCDLCPHACLLNPGQTGRCRVRTNVEGSLMARSYGKLSGFHMDPIEKKPLYHYFPGSMILSVGSYGCNFRCPWCQNAGISQCGAGQRGGRRTHTPSEVAEAARRSESIGVAYTYNEPTVWFEFMMDTAVLVHEAGGRNVVVTNGYINPGPLEDLLAVSHAFNVDFKSFSDGFYRKQSQGSLQPVKNTLKAIARKGLHLEITFLVIPGLNDDMALFDRMLRWIREELGTEVVLHINRYFPSWQMNTPPTSLELMHRMHAVARKHLPLVYLGNVP